jgi:two-component system, OmpR family, sensor histidine kinase KdpD
MARGRHKIFLGMAIGVGKTYRMLQEGRAERREGRDVVIGLVEPHGRPETAQQAEGFETIPRMQVSYGGATLWEMDLSAILRRRPELCLIDEIAHTNPPGLAHSKRYEDAADVLAAGVDVYSTVNVQHLESLSARVAELTGATIHETLPDRVIDEADEVVVVDLTPKALATRIREGKVFPARNVPRALNGFFVESNLDVLREMALLQVAEEVEAHRLAADVLTADDRLISNIRPARQERFLALVTPESSAGRILRRAWGASQRMNAKLDALWVVPAGAATDAGTHEQADALRRLASVFGAELIVAHDKSIPAAGAKIATERGTSSVVMGSPSRRRGVLHLGRSLPDAILDAVPHAELRIVRTHRD